MSDILVDTNGDGTFDKDDTAGGLPNITDESGDGKLDVNITQANSSAVIGGAIFQDAANVGAGTGNYNTFLALQDDSEDDATTGTDFDSVETGFNAGQSDGGAQANPEDDSNDEMDASKSEAILLGAIPIKIVDGVAYYEFRVDLNEANSGSDTLISLDQFQLYVGPYDLDGDPPNPDPATKGQNDPNVDLVDTFSELQTLNKVYDMDAGRDVSVLMDEANSSGSGNDDYVVLVPIANFAGLDPASTYVYLFVQMGAAGGDGDGDGAIGDKPGQNNVGDSQTWVVNGGFHEWNLQNAVIIQGQKFTDTDGDGVKDPGEVGQAGVTIYIDDDLDGVVEATDNNGVLDAGEQFDITDADGNYSFGGIPVRATDYTIYIREVVPAGQVPTTDLPVAVLIDNAAAAGSIIGIDDVPGLLIGNTTPTFDISGTKMIDTNGDGTLQAGETTAHAGVTIFIDDDGDGVVEATDNNGALDAGELSTTTAANGSWSFTGLSANYTGAKVRELASGDFITTIGGSGLTITGTPDNDQTGLLFANFEKFDISGTKMIDTNGDGTLQAGETTAHAGVTIFIDDDGDGVVEATDNNGALDAGELSTTTAADGSWSFTDLGVGYAGAKVRELASGDFITTIGGSGLTITGTSGADQTGLLFANFEKFDISGTKMIDTNGDGTLQAGETTAHAGVTIFIDDDGDGVVEATDNNGALDAGELSTTTAADGSWSFTDLGVGYAGAKVRELASGDFITTIGGSGLTITGTSGADQTGLLFANFEKFDISGTKMIDTNGDGTLQAGETTPHAGVTIFIDDDGDGVVEATDNNGALDAGELSTTTAADGSWSFTDLGVGYAGSKVRELASGDFITTIGGSGLTITGTSGADQTGLLFANFDPDPSISIIKYVKTDVSGSFVDANDPDGPEASTSTTVYFKAVVTNDGNEALSGIGILDSIDHDSVETDEVVDYTAIGAEIDIDNDGIIDGLWSDYDTDGDGILDDADGNIATDDDFVLGVGELFAVYYSLNSSLGQHENTAAVSAVSEISDTNVTAEDDANYYVVESEDCVGVRTPGFWQNSKWGLFWNFDPTKPATATDQNALPQNGTPGFATGELLYAIDTSKNGVVDGGDTNNAGLLIGDYNMNGITDAGEDTIFISLSDAKLLINASNKNVGDGKTADGIWMLGRDVVATWLNYLANNQESDGGLCVGDVDTGDGTNTPREFLDAAIDWLQQFAATDNGANLNQNLANSYHDGLEQAVFQFDARIAPSSGAWQNPFAVGQAIPVSAAAMHSALDGYNNTGMIGGVEYCCDADSEIVHNVLTQISLI